MTTEAGRSLRLTSCDELLSSSVQPSVMQLQNPRGPGLVVCVRESHTVSLLYVYLIVYCLQCFDTVGWATGRASGL